MVAFGNVTITGPFGRESIQEEKPCYLKVRVDACISMENYTEIEYDDDGQITGVDRGTRICIKADREGECTCNPVDQDSPDFEPPAGLGIGDGWCTTWTVNREVPFCGCPNRCTGGPFNDEWSDCVDISNTVFRNIDDAWRSFEVEGVVVFLGSQAEKMVATCCEPMPDA